MPLKYDVDRMPYMVLKEKVQAPKFQRNFVWKKKARNDLINSLKEGLPVGAFLLQRLPDGKYNIIDGRQRLSTLMDYENHRSKYISESDIDESEISDIFKKIDGIGEKYNGYSDSAKRTILSNVKKTILSQMRLDGAETTDIVYDICVKVEDELALNPKTDAEAIKRLNKEITAYVNRHLQILDLNEIVLPCIIFNEIATDDEIVTAFVNLNSKGTKLSKYDLYSANWQDLLIKVDDDEILDKVISKYKDSLAGNQNIETEGFNETEIRDRKEINVFEYAYALSKLIGERCSKMYKIKEASEVDSLGFSILAGIFDIGSAKMINLGDTLAKSGLDYKDLKDKVIDCAVQVEKRLSNVCVSPSGAEYFNHSYNQIVTFIVTVFKTVYKIEDGKIKDDPDGRKSIKEFYENMPLWYLYDNISGYWAGTGDKKADNLMITDDITSSRYFTRVDEEDFRNALRKWLTEENEDKNSNVKPESKLFINYIVAKRCDKNTYCKGMDIEHIVPQSKLERLQAKGGNGAVLGVSSPTNLALLPKYDSLPKHDDTYYEARDSRSGVTSIEEDDLEKYYIYPRREEIKFAEGNGLTVENFDLFKKERTDELINDFMELYYRG